MNNEREAIRRVKVNVIHNAGWLNVVVSDLDKRVLLTAETEMDGYKDFIKACPESARRKIELTIEKAEEDSTWDYAGLADTMVYVSCEWADNKRRGRQYEI